MLTIENLTELLENHVVEIPIIQRDYAQGRRDDHATLVRSKLLTDIKAALLGETLPLDLNFVYGKVCDGKFIPLDGQQRLTTLFFLHLYAFRNDDSMTQLLHKFTYETRKSSRTFFEALVNKRKNIFSGEGTVSHEITDSEWFITEWGNDPTVHSSLVVIDHIVDLFSGVDHLSERLTQKENKPLIFHFLNMDDLGMEDSLYIKLNARGKSLTDFENFKARLFARLKITCPDLSAEFESLFDGKWTDFFWHQLQENFDDGFLRFFQVLLVNNDIINMTSNWANHFDFDKLHENLFYNIYNVLNATSLDEFPKIRELILNGIKQNSNYHDRLLFHAVTEYIRVTGGKIECSINEWLRVARNLIVNSQIDDTRTNASALKGLNELVVNYANVLEFLSKEGKVNGFSREQVKEEIIKAKILHSSPEFADMIYDAEKNEYFTGTIRPSLNFSYQNNDFKSEIFSTYWKKIELLFDSEGLKYGNLIRQALLTYSDYTLKVKDYNTLCVNDSKESTSTPSIKRIFSDHPDKVRGLLDDLDTDTDIETQLKNRVNDSDIPQNEWRYCFIKYPFIFNLMNTSQLRIRFLKKRILVVSRISTSGYNTDLYLSALSSKLDTLGITSQQQPDDLGTWAEIYLYIADKYKVCFKDYKFIIYFNDIEQCVFDGPTMIDSAANYLESNIRKISTLQ